MSLTEAEIRRYSRQLSLEEIGIEGQEKLRGASVLCVGAGGLGSPVCLYLAAAGIGTIGIVDGDVLDESNLQRQILHDVHGLGMPKAANASKRITELNPHPVVKTHKIRFTEENGRELVGSYDAVIDACDNYATRFLINKACIAEGKPMVHGAVAGFKGEVGVFIPSLGGPCYRCVVPHAPPPPAPVDLPGVFGAVPGVIGSWQVIETIKYLLGKGELLTGALLCFDMLNPRVTKIQLRKDPHCPDCGK